MLVKNATCLFNIKLEVLSLGDKCPSVLSLSFHASLTLPPPALHSLLPGQVRQGLTSLTVKRELVGLVLN